MGNNIERSKIKMEVPYFQVPNSIFDLGLDLNIYHKMVYLYLCRCCNQGSDAFPSYNTIAKKCGMSRRKAIDTVNELIKYDLLSKEIRITSPKINSSKECNDTNVYTLNDPSAYNAPHTQCTECTTVVHDIHQSSAQDAPNKELSINKYLKRTNKVVVEAYANAKGKSLTKAEKNKLIELCNVYDKDIILKAIDMTVEQANNVNIKYIRTILESFKAKGLSTLQEVEAHLRSENNANKKVRDNRCKAVKGYSKNKVDTFNDYEQREYDFAELEKGLLGEL